MTISSRRTSTIRRLRDPNRTICVSLIRLRTADDGTVDLAKGTSRMCDSRHASQACDFSSGGNAPPPSRLLAAVITCLVRNTSISGIPRRIPSSRVKCDCRAYVLCVAAHDRIRVCACHARVCVCQRARTHMSKHQK